MTKKPKFPLKPKTPRKAKNALFWFDPGNVAAQNAHPAPRFKVQKLKSEKILKFAKRLS